MSNTSTDNTPFTPLENPEWLSSWRSAARALAAKLPVTEHYGIGIDSLTPRAVSQTWVAPEYRVEASKGLELSTWKEALAQEETAVFLKRLFSSELLPQARAHLSAIGRAEFSSALVVYVQPTLDDVGTATEETLLLETTIPHAACADLLIVIAKTGARLRMTDRVIGGGAESVHTRTTIIITEEDAVVSGKTETTMKGFFHGEIIGLVGPYATCQWTEEPDVSEGYRSLSLLRLLGPSATGASSAILLTNDGQAVDIQNEVEHCASETHARVVAVGAAADASRIVYRGSIRMKEGVTNTHGEQEGKFLILAPTARVDAIPALDIASKHVQSSHRLSVTHIKDEDLFYAESRGVSREESRSLALEGFFGSICAPEAHDELSPSLRERITQLIHRS